MLYYNNEISQKYPKLLKYFENGYHKLCPNNIALTYNPIYILISPNIK